MTKQEIQKKIAEVEAQYDVLETAQGAQGSTPEMDKLIAEMDALYKQLAITA